MDEVEIACGTACVVVSRVKVGWSIFEWDAATLAFSFGVRFAVTGQVDQRVNAELRVVCRCVLT